MSNLGIKYTTFLIDEFTLKNNSQLSFNIQTSKLNASIINAQIDRIEPVLGNDLFVDILTEVENLTITASNATLLYDYINPALIQWTLFEATLDISFLWFNGGVGQYNNPEIKPADISTLQLLRDEIKNKAEYRSQRLYKYLCDNASLFPLWLNCNDPIALRPKYSFGLDWTNNRKPLI